MDLPVDEQMFSDEFINSEVKYYLSSPDTYFNYPSMPLKCSGRSTNSFDEFMSGSGINFNGDLSIEEDLQGSHRILRVDVSPLDSTTIALPINFIEAVSDRLKIMKATKIQFGIITEWTKDGEHKKSTISNAAEFMNENFVEHAIQRLNEKIEARTQIGSNWILERINEVFFIITRISNLTRLSGRGYIETPSSLKIKKAVVNIQNGDKTNCFLLSILSLLKREEIGHNFHRESNYEVYQNTLNCNNIQLPMRLVDIPKFEAQNPGLAINVLSYTDINFKDSNDDDDNAGLKHPFIDIIHRTKVMNVEPLYLLMLEKKDNFHYTAVHNLHRLLNLDNDLVSSTRIQSFWCTQCLCGFRRKITLEKHKILCEKNLLATTLYTLPVDNKLEFRDWSKTMTPPYVLYADFEAILPKDSKCHQMHKPIAAGCVLINNYNGEMNYQYFVGEDCVVQFLNYINETVKTVLQFYKDKMNASMIPLTRDEEQQLSYAVKCYLCNKKEQYLVRDHCHFSGKFLGAACNKCNLSRKVRKVFPIVFHNLRGYDMHHILKYGLSKMDWELTCIPNTTEKFTSLFGSTQGLRIRFIDSYSFVDTSLKKAVSNLTSTPITNMLMDNANIRSSKGIFPYDFATSLEVLNQTFSLPPIWSGVSDSDYAVAKACWEEAGCKNLLDYMLVYLKLDVLLLADVFQQFRSKCLNHNKLEPLNFFGNPGLSWASALLTLEEPIELLTDMTMYDFFDAGIRGGMTFVNKHHVAAGEGVELMYIDINNLYGWALSQHLPKSDFKWVLDEPTLSEMLDICKSNIEISEWEFGCIMEVDIHIPESLHDFLDQMPIAPEKNCPPGSNVPKLLMTHEDKLNYPLHWRLLQYFIQLGAVVKKVHRAITFAQAPVFKNYIVTNTKLRSEATNKVDSNFYKLLNNSLYGKTVENLRKRLNLRLCTTATKLMTYTSKASFRKSIKIDNDLVAVMLNKESIYLDRPSYIGQTVLDLSKLRMYKLKYDELRKYETQFGCQLNIIAGDTDSFFLESLNVSVRDQLIPAMIADD